MVVLGKGYGYSRPIVSINLKLGTSVRLFYIRNLAAECVVYRCLVKGQVIRDYSLFKFEVIPEFSIS